LRRIGWQHFLAYFEIDNPSPSGSPLIRKDDHGSGPDINLANVTHDTIMDLEAARTSLGTAGPGSALAEQANRVAAVAL
jgi:hypothetical protein